MTDETKPARLDAVATAAFQMDVERERRMELLRQGRLPYLEAEHLTAELCAQGDAERRKAAEAEERASRERGARIRAGTTSK